MPALVAGLLVRHLDKAGDALDPFFTEPMIWILEFERVAKESAGLAAVSEGLHAPERRKWSLREAARALVLAADGQRIDALRELGERLVVRARELEDHESEGKRTGGEGISLSHKLAVVRGWASALDRRELEAEPIDWPNLLAWRRQVERWLPAAAGNAKCVDSLVRRLDSLEAAEQAAVGLSWIEVLVEGGPEKVASNSWHLPDWLRKLQPHVQGTEHLSSWRRIVDMLVVAGDTRVSELSD